jgi:cell division topological specificity factor
MLEFFKRFFNPEPSSVTARERLRLVLLSDHLALAPDVVESLKSDLIAVISKYVDVDAANCDVTFEQQDRQVAMLANIPILGMKPADRKPPAPPSAAAQPPAPAPDVPPAFGGPSPVSAAIAAEPEAVLGVAAERAPVFAAAVEPAVAEDAPVAVKAGAQPRRRKRRRRTPGNATLAGTAPAAG